jgi:hypothetical protein
MVFTHDVADQTGRFAIGAAGDIAAFLRGVEDAAVDGLQAVADVGQCARHDHAHRVIEVRGLHLVDDPRRKRRLPRQPPNIRQPCRRRFSPHRKR